MVQIVYDIYFNAVYILSKIGAIPLQPGDGFHCYLFKKWQSAFLILRSREDLDEVKIFQDWSLILWKRIR